MSGLYVVILMVRKYNKLGNTLTKVCASYELTQFQQLDNCERKENPVSYDLKKQRPTAKSWGIKL